MASRAAWLAGVVALMPLAAGWLADVPAAAAASTSPFAAPERPMLLTRAVHRPLPDGKAVSSRRSYEVRFVREGDGYRVDGKLVSVEVDAPPALAGLAALERRRADEGMFPMRLDREGRLVAEGTPQRAEEVTLAIAAVSAAASLDTIGTLDRLQAEAFLRQLQTQQARSPWPEDLFRPATGSRRTDRFVPLVNGGRGRVTIETAARAAEDSGLLISFERTVTSDLEGDTRSMRETWTLDRN